MKDEGQRQSTVSSGYCFLSVINFYLSSYFVERGRKTEAKRGGKKEQLIVRRRGPEDVGLALAKLSRKSLCVKSKQKYRYKLGQVSLYSQKRGYRRLIVRISFFQFPFFFWWCFFFAIVFSISSPFRCLKTRGCGGSPFYILSSVFNFCEKNFASFTMQYLYEISSTYL